MKWVTFEQMEDWWNDAVWALMGSIVPAGRNRLPHEQRQVVGHINETLVIYRKLWGGEPGREVMLARLEELANKYKLGGKGGWTVSDRLDADHTRSRLLKRMRGELAELRRQRYCTVFEEAVREGRELGLNMRRLKGPRSPPIGAVLDSKGGCRTGREAREEIERRVDKWFECTHPPQEDSQREYWETDSCEVDWAPFTIPEMRQAMASVAQHSAPGPTKMPVIGLKYMTDGMARRLVDHLNAFKEIGHIPERWRKRGNGLGP